MKILVAGGGTVAPIDDVRRITNLSTGRFAASIAEQWLAAGANVHYLHAPGAERPLLRRARLDLLLDRSSPEQLRRELDSAVESWLGAKDRLRLDPLETGTVDEYATILEQRLRAEPFEAVFLAIAVSDYQPVPTVGKLRSDDDEILIRCRRTRKVIQSVRDWQPSAYLVGFKLLSDVSESELIDAAELANQTNRADLTVANDLALYRQGRHTIHLVRPGRTVETYDQDVAARLVSRVTCWLREARGPVSHDRP